MLWVVIKAHPTILDYIGADSRLRNLTYRILNTSKLYNINTGELSLILIFRIMPRGARTDSSSWYRIVTCAQLPSPVSIWGRARKADGTRVLQCPRSKIHSSVILTIERSKECIKKPLSSARYNSKTRKLTSTFGLAGGAISRVLCHRHPLKNRCFFLCRRGCN